MTVEVKEKRKRVRRNYERELRWLSDYVAIKVEVLESMNGNGANYTQAIESYKDVLSRLRGGK
jgi:hypothetical protein